MIFGAGMHKAERDIIINICRQNDIPIYRCPFVGEIGDGLSTLPPSIFLVI
jgi:hypothetical protein